MSREILPGIKQFDLSGKVALVTGGSKGLGLAMAAGLASAGAKIMLVNRNADEGIQAAKDLATDFGVEAISFSADVSDSAANRSNGKGSNGTFGQIDILINSAGINIRGPIDELQPGGLQQSDACQRNGYLALLTRCNSPHEEK